MNVKTRSLFLILIMAVVSIGAASAQMASKSPARGSSPVVSDPESERGGPELVGDANNPVLRYPVGHQHAMSGCLGYLYISKDRMKFESKTEPAHSFDQARSDLTV